LLVFGFLGGWLSVIEGLFVPATVLLLCFMMGLQNAVISKLSNAEIRTTHVTGIGTDISIGIELGKLSYWNRRHPMVEQQLVLANRDRLKVLGHHGTVVLRRIASWCAGPRPSRRGTVSAQASPMSRAVTPSKTCWS